MTGDRINIRWAREYAERFPNAKYIHLRPREVVALVEAVEALKWQQDQIGWDPNTPPARALARFDFGEHDHDPVLEQEC